MVPDDSHMSVVESDLPTLSSLPDALLQHVLSYLSSDISALGRMLCSSAALSMTGRDDAVWGPLCRSRFGLEGLYDPEGAPVASYWHAARAWTQLCEQQGEPELWGSMMMVARITVGARVTLTGLSRVELNGRHGRALQQLPSGRWEVEIDGTDGPAPLSVRPEGGDGAMRTVLACRADTLRLCETPLVPLFAPMWIRAAGAWRVARGAWRVARGAWRVLAARIGAGVRVESLSLERFRKLPLTGTLAHLSP